MASASTSVLAASAQPKVDDEETLTVRAHRCSKHNSLEHEFFISYRVFCDKVNAEKLAALLDGYSSPSGNNFDTFLDKNCLVQGQDWEAGFTNGIHHSKCILVMLSELVISSLKGKAIKGEVDNVFKEHKMALELKKNKDVLVIPIYVASFGKTQSGRDSYVKLDHAKSLRVFDDHEDDPEIHKRLQDVKNTLAAIFALPGVNIEPDSIPEKVPKIVELWYDKFVNVNVKHKATSTYQKIINNWILYPSQSFRLTIIGMLMGFALIVSLVLLFMPSKSRKHTDLKKGIAIGNIIGFIIIIIICAVFYTKNDNYSKGLYCLGCEAMITLEGSSSEDVNILYEAIPDIFGLLHDCACDKNGPITEQGDWLTAECLSCTCKDIYKKCEISVAVAYVLQVLMIFGALLILATAVFVHRFTQTEAYSLSF